MKKRPGYTLIDMLLAIALLGGFMLMAFRLVRATVHITAATLNADDNTARFDNAIHMLRDDVAASTHIEMPATHQLQIRRTSGPPVQWKIEQNSLSRTTNTEHRTWDVGQPIDLKMDGSILLILPSPLDQIAIAPPMGAHP
jgi:type II secretory pathway component PulJ